MIREALTDVQRSCLKAAVRAKALVRTRAGWRASDDLSGRGYFSRLVVEGLADLRLIDFDADRSSATPTERGRRQVVLEL